MDPFFWGENLEKLFENVDFLELLEVSDYQKFLLCTCKRHIYPSKVVQKQFINVFNRKLDNNAVFIDSLRFIDCKNFNFLIQEFWGQILHLDIIRGYYTDLLGLDWAFYHAFDYENNNIWLNLWKFILFNLLLILWK